MPIQPVSIQKHYYPANTEVVKKPLYESKDVSLAILNMARLGSTVALTMVSPATAYYLGIISQITALYQKVLAQIQSPPGTGHWLEKIANQPLFAILGYSGAFPLAGKVHALGVSSSVLRNAGPQLLNSIKQAVKTPFESLKASFLHLFNLTSQAYFTWQDFEFFNQLGKVSLATPSETCSTKSEKDFEKMPLMERFTTSDFNPKCPADGLKAFQHKVNPKCEESAETALLYKQALDAGHNLIPEQKRDKKMEQAAKESVTAGLSETLKSTCRDTCAAIKNFFRKASQQIHPDKNKEPQAGEAFRQLNLAYETLKERYGCSK